MQIKCPSCGKKFRSVVDLAGKTVECGSCDHRFKVDDTSVVKEANKKFYPGERNADFLARLTPAEEHYMGPEAKQPNFRPAAYQGDSNQAPIIDDVLPVGPGPQIALICSLFTAGLFLLVGLLGIRSGGFLAMMPMQNRLVFGGFGALLIIVLMIIAHPRKRTRGVLYGLFLGLPIMAIPHFVLPEGAGDEDLPLSRSLREPSENLLGQEESADEIKARVIYSPIEDKIHKAILSGNSEAKGVYGIYLKGMQGRYTIQVQDFLQVATSSPGRPVVNSRPSQDSPNKNYLVVGTGSLLNLEEVAERCSSFATIDKVYPELLLIEATVREEALVINDSTELADTKHPNFYRLNLNELKGINQFSIDQALLRLAGVPPSEYNTEMRKQLGVLAKTTKRARLAAVAKTMKVWTPADDPSLSIVLESAFPMNKKPLGIPHSVLDLFVEKKFAPAYSLIKEAWLKAVLDKQGLMTRLGTDAEPLVLPYLKDGDNGQKQSAVIILRSSGTSKSVDSLKALQKDANTEFSRVIQATLDSIASRQ